MSQRIMTRFTDEFKIDVSSGQFTSAQLLSRHPELTMKKICNYAYHHDIKLPRHTNFDEAFFMTQTPNMAYVLGWLAADGSVSDENSIHLSLKSTDIKVIQDIAEMISLKNPIHTSSTFDKRTEKTYQRSYIGFASKTVAEELGKYGIVPRKSLTLCYPQNIETDDLKRHFIRGYLDGDGCIQRMGNTDTSVSFVGTSHFILDLQKDINRMLGWDVKGTIQNYRSWYVLKYGGNASSLTLLTWLYKDTTPETRLDRKYAKYQDLITMYAKRKKPVMRRDMDGSNPVTYASVEEATEQNNLRKQTLEAHLRGQNKSCGGYLFNKIQQ